MSAISGIKTEINTKSAVGFNEEASDRLAKHGTAIYNDGTDYLQRPSIYMERIQSGTKGFGTAITRKIVKESLEKGFGGRYHTSASWSSHLFHLYMGMLPEDAQVRYVPIQYGNCGKRTLKELPTIIKNIKEKKTNDKLDLKYLKIMLADLKQVDEKTITDEMIVSHEQELTAFKDKKCSYLQYDFIPQILDILKCSPNEKKPNTSSLHAISMMLSDEGLKRWKDAIANKKPFVPFRKLEHLRPFMNEEQLKSLDAIMEARDKAFSKK